MSYEGAGSRARFEPAAGQGVILDWPTGRALDPAKFGGHDEVLTRLQGSLRLESGADSGEPLLQVGFVDEATLQQ
jgi:hypothetical protein